ncbi:hypothetical protein [Desulfovibrio sp.]|uniref:hypothetical protein n=1 Tax=Desulfovibrio sp. TaxID=885 RepID=UPI0023CD2201|nr:hypothetical protein [Desulfovibrio sp.]MDE7241958.1 hypothetical protein [Desulfovibrio sp.]
MFSALLFIFFCFFGILAALFYLLKRQEQAWQLLRDEHAQLRVLLRALESRLEYLAAVCLDPEQARRAEARAATAAGDDKPGASSAPVSAGPAGASGTDPLLRLSFEEPEGPRAPAGREAGHDPALELRFAPGEEDARR